MGNAKSTEKEDKKIIEKEETKDKKKKTHEKRSSVGVVTKKPLLNSSQRSIIKYCIDNAHADMAERIVRRACEKKGDYKIFVDSLSKEQRAEHVETLKEFLLTVCSHLLDQETIQKKCLEYGARHTSLRSLGFKPDFFARTADAVTTECTFLDGATHTTTDTATAWSQLSTFVFSNVRDGYYGELRRQRKSSNGFARAASSAELSSADDSTEKRSRSPSGEEEKEAEKNEEEDDKEKENKGEGEKEEEESSDRKSGEKSEGEGEGEGEEEIQENGDNEKNEVTASLS